MFSRRCCTKLCCKWFIIFKKIFKNIWIQPASGDAGGALGAALSIWHLYYLKERKIENGKDKMCGSYLGPSFTNKEIENQLKAMEPYI